MRYKAVLFDADGVTIKGRSRYFSDTLSIEKNVPLDQILPFFKKEYPLCATGKADLKKSLKPYLSRWKWNEGIDAFLTYWFESESNVEEGVLRMASQLRENEIITALVSDNEKYRAAYILDEMHLGDSFDHTFFSYEFRYKKDTREFFEIIVERLHMRPEDILYWDDDEGNLKPASEVGIHTMLYRDFQSFQEKMGEIFPKIHNQ